MKIKRSWKSSSSTNFTNVNLRPRKRDSIHNHTASEQERVRIQDFQFHTSIWFQQKFEHEEYTFINQIYVSN